MTNWGYCCGGPYHGSEFAHRDNRVAVVEGDERGEYRWENSARWGWWPERKKRAKKCPSK